jgi:hypothetical protein
LVLIPAPFLTRGRDQPNCLRCRHRRSDHRGSQIRDRITVLRWGPARQRRGIFVRPVATRHASIRSLGGNCWPCGGVSSSDTLRAEQIGTRSTLPSRALGPRMGERGLVHLDQKLKL